MKAYFEEGCYEMELDEHYCDEGGHYHPECAPDGRDLYDAYVERTVIPSFNDKFRLEDLQNIIEETEVYLSRRIDYLDERIEALEAKIDDHDHAFSDQCERIDLIEQTLVDHVFPFKFITPDDYDTQCQVEEDWRAYSEDWDRPDTDDCMNCNLTTCDDCYYLKEKEPIFLEDEPQEELPPDFWENGYPQRTTLTYLVHGVQVTTVFPTLEEALKYVETMR